MGSCPSCGYRSLFSVPTKQCILCGKVFCANCVPTAYGVLNIKTEMERGNSAGIYEEVGFCSNSCSEQFGAMVNNYVIAGEIGTDITAFNDNVVSVWNQAILNAVSADFKTRIENTIRIHSRNYPAIPWWDEQQKIFGIYETFYCKGKAALAKNLERCGRTQDAAKIFEDLRMYDKARELREKDRHIIIKNTNVSVNLNALLQQVKDGGIVAVFRCPHCGGKLRVSKNTTLDSLKICEHCSCEIESMDLADFLKTTLT
jgi:hypothetical protein